MIAWKVGDRVRVSRFGAPSIPGVVHLVDGRKIGVIYTWNGERFYGLFNGAKLRRDRRRS